MSKLSGVRVGLPTAQVVLLLPDLRTRDCNFSWHENHDLTVSTFASSATNYDECKTGLDPFRFNLPAWYFQRLTKRDGMALGDCRRCRLAARGKDFENLGWLEITA